MATSHFQQFLSNALSPGPDTDHPARPGCLYGLYASRCPFDGVEPKRDALWQGGIHQQRADILSSYPGAG